MKNILLFIIISFFSHNLFSQQILDEMQLEDISDTPEIKSVIIRNPDQALLIVKSQISSLRVESNNVIIKAKQVEAGKWYFYLTPGTHRLSFQSGSFISVIKRFYFNPKDVIGINIRIITAVEKKISKNSGIIVINSKPDHAQVFFDDEFYGNTPYIGKLINGRYSLRLRKKNYNDFAKEVIVVADQTLAVDADLLDYKSDELDTNDLLTKKDLAETQVDQQSERIIYVSPKFGFSLFTGIAGIELIIKKISFNFGFLLVQNEWYGFGIKYYFKPDQDSYYCSVGRSVGYYERNKTVKKSFNGVTIGKYWKWKNGFNLNFGIGVGVQERISKDSSGEWKEPSSENFPLIELSFGYLFYK